MLGNKMDLSSCAIWTGFHKSSHISSIVSSPVLMFADDMKIFRVISNGETTLHCRMT